MLDLVLVLFFFVDCLFVVMMWLCLFVMLVVFGLLLRNFLE